MIKALIFDFDGLIFDTEKSDYISWKETYEKYGVELPLNLWQSFIGSIGFDLYGYLEEQLGESVDREAVRAQRKTRDNEILAQETILPGVEQYLADARFNNLQIGLASSSKHDWVEPHLQRLGLTDWFDAVCCRDDVDNQAKPNPAVYRLALRRLGVPPEAALALEDSPNGIAAAKRAGVWVTAVPNEMTKTLDLSQADYRLESLTQMPLEQLINEVLNGKNKLPEDC